MKPHGGLLQKITRLYSRLSGRMASSALSFKNWLSFVGSPLGIPSDVELENAYLTSATVAACVNEIVDAVSVLDLRVEGAPYLNLLLNRPSADSDWPQFISDFTRKYLVCGASFLWKQRDGAAISRLISVPTSAVEWRRDGRFTLTVEGKQETVSRLDLPGMMIVSIKSTRKWMSLLGSAWQEIQLDGQKNNYLRTTLSNLADASLVIESEQPNSAEQRSDLRESIEQGAGGAHRGGILVLPPGFSAKTPGKMRDLSLSGVGKTIEAHISAVLNVPSVLVGLEVGLAQMTYSNYYEARESFDVETILPLAKRISAFLTRVLIEDEGLRGTITLERAPDPAAEKKKADKEENADAKTRIENEAPPA